MVVLEAFAAQIPVIGSNLGGIAELVTDGVNGLLVEASSANSWVKAIKNLSDNRYIVTQLRENIKCPATMEIVAKKMNVIYDNLIVK
jgi:glycosyltransferase involved in cell wall biosynthesis